MFTPKLTHDFWERLKDASESLDVSCSRNCCADYFERIGHLERLIAGIKCHLNTHVPVSCLPPEILSQIFMHYAHPVHSDGTYQDSKSYITLLNISQVCSRWRQTVLGDPRLWTHVPAHCLPAASAFLERSRGLPLTIWGNVPMPEENKDIRPMGNLNIPMECVQSISFKIAENPRLRTSYCTLPSQPAPQLRLLHLSCDSAGTPIALGSLPFCGDTSLLDTVILQSVSPSWTWVEMLCGLTTLVIDNPRPVANIPEDFRTVLSALRKMPNLIRLELCSEQRNLPSDSDLDSDEERNPNYLGPAILPHLRRLRLRSFVAGVYFLLARLSLPQSAYVDLTSEQFGDGEEGELDIWDLSAALARHYALQLDTSSISRPKSLSIRMLSSRAFTVHIASDSRQLFNQPYLPKQSLLTLNMPDTQVEAEVLLPAFTMELLDMFTDSPNASFSFDTLIIDACLAHVDFKKCYWMSYPRLSIARIMLIGAFVESFAAAFASQVSIAESQAHEAESLAHEAESQVHEAESQAHEAGCLCLPFLEQLEVHQFNFIFSGTAFRDIVIGLKRRKMLFGPDRGVLRVGIRDCIIRARQVEELRATCDHFEWDGKTNCIEE